ncbi:valine--tRNA ligase [Thalassospiraceae bacterium LMO-SO8]|nr:valine--tRNA ligase [Alphaproteobacteria bacterium LMO-S08]WND75373.1 valine--tRNA ligase [Thalassospiraceae bacterium LMO-SO8]
MAELEKTYHPDAVETRRYQEWEQSGAFAPGQGQVEGGNGQPYTIVIPPPNVTGSLHMGHALNNTLQDILIRYRRMKGDAALWQPGTDHAGIATQMVVERMLEAEGVKRTDLGRDKFVERVWDWKAESGGTITKQLRRLGASCDWSRERFTMDEGLSKAVVKVFVELHKQGLIYRDKRLVNWDPKLHTAISDLEVEQRETKGKMWYFKYPIEGQDGKFITVGTTRPETMLGDTGVAVHPDDERYTDLVGKNVVLPITGRLIPIVADHYADPEKGSGAVKITPGHDFNDFEVGKRAGLDIINILDANAHLNENVPAKYQGMERFKARDAVLAEMEGLGLLERVEDNDMTVPHGDRSGVVVEPWLMDQWFVDAKTLAKPAIEAVESGKTQFVPKTWENTYFEWMRNIQPWCVSRQLWWGHQIPAWFGPDGAVFVEMSEEAAQAAADAHYGKAVELTRDPDVLDTWFSSALWPFSTLGWPDETPELARHYPTDVLVTGFDIIFFWVARMMMMGIHFMGEVPFHTVYIHALVRDEKGQKMSKSKGNVIDPLDLIEKFGADALRFTLTAFAAQGRDVKMSESRVEGYRNFCTKIWNAARFCDMNECRVDPDFNPNSVNSTLNRWIVGKVSEAETAMTMALDAYRFNDAAGALYSFTWNTFCDWYLEFAKPVFMGSDETAKAETRATTAWVLDQIITLLHPIVPFITEELWQTRAERAQPLITTPWPVYDPALVDAAVNAEMDWVVRLISQIRAVRSEMNVPPKAKIPMLLKDGDAAAQAALATHRDLILRLAGLSDAGVLTGEVPKGAVQDVLDGAMVILPIADAIDLEAEKARLLKEISKQDAEIDRFEKKLGNAKFVANAPAEVVETEREKLGEAQATRGRLDEALKRLATVG